MKRITTSSRPNRIQWVQRGALSVLCGVGRGTTTRVALVPLSAIGSTLISVSTTVVFGWFVSWISSVVILDLCHSASLNSERAAGLDLTTKDTGEHHRRKVTHKTTHKTTQHAYARDCSESPTDLPAQEKTPVLLGSAADCDSVPQIKVEDRGLEPLTFWLPARRSPN